MLHAERGEVRDKRVHAGVWNDSPGAPNLLFRHLLATDPLSSFARVRLWAWTPTDLQMHQYQHVRLPNRHELLIQYLEGCIFQCLRRND